MNEISIYYAFCTTTIFLFSFYRSNRLKKITYDKKKRATQWQSQQHRQA